MKWIKDAKEGRILAGGHGQGRDFKQLYCPAGVIVDRLDQVYVADCGNHRIMRWCEGKEEGEIIVGGDGDGDQLNVPMGLSFDDKGNIYVTDRWNYRIEKFEIIIKKYCHYPSEHGLTRDESASIYVYTMEWGEQTLYRVLNKILRNEIRHLCKIWFPYLKLFDTALNKLPTVKEIVWRGITEDIGKKFHENQIITWWSVNSCSSKVSVIKGFLGNKKNSTTFLIEVLNGIKVSGHTEHESEHEIILRMGTELR
ncbi:unnamed protein product, partial [Adineta steineri]